MFPDKSKQHVHEWGAERDVHKAFLLRHRRRRLGSPLWRMPSQSWKLHERASTTPVYR